MSLFIDILFIAVGAFILTASIINWDWFFTSTKIQRVVNLLGRTGTRILYSIASLILIFYGIAYITGLID